MKLHNQGKSFKYFVLLGMFICVCMTGCQRMPTSNFQRLAVSQFPNYFLLCPKNYCNVTPSAESPVFPVPAEELFNFFNEIISKEQNINFVYSMPEQGQFGLTAHSNFFHFPDDIDVQFIALSNTTSTLAIYSKSRFSYYDFGSNRHRIEEWIGALMKRSKSVPPPQVTPLP